MAMRTAVLLLIASLVSSAAFADSTWTYALTPTIRITVIESLFQRNAHHVELCTEQPVPCKIDGQFPFGTMMEWPTTELTKLSVRIRSKEYVLDTAGMYNAWGWRATGSNYKSSIAVRHIGPNRYRVRGAFAGEVATYVAEWEINGKLVRRKLLSNDEATVQRITLALERGHA